MNIAIIGPRSLGYTAGIDHYVTETVARLSSKECKFTIYCRRLYKDDVDKSENIKKIKVATLNNKYLETPLYALLATFHALFGKYDIIHFQGLGSAFCAFIPRIFGKRTLATIHALDWEGKKWGYLSKKILKLNGWIAAKFAHKTTVVSKVVQDYFRKYYNCEAIYTPNVVNVLPPRKPELIKKYGIDKNNYILFIGRMAPGKGCEYLISAFRKIDTGMKLVIAGDTIHEHDYMEKLKEKASEDIIFVGWVKDQLKEELFSNAYLFVQPSELEGMSSVLLEAMSYGRCIVASNIPQNAEVLRGVGYLFENKNVDSLKEAIKLLLHDDRGVVRMGELARERVLKDYGWEKMIKLWKDIYQVGDL